MERGIYPFENYKIVWRKVIVWNLTQRKEKEGFEGREWERKV
jgi:hypothetical protein